MTSQPTLPLLHADGFLFVVDWPVKALSQNARVHWAAKAAARAAQREQARSQATLAHRAAWDNGGTALTLPAGGVVQVDILFRPPTKARRDAPNVLDALKAALDGLMDAINIDDSRFRVTYDWGETDPPFGCVVFAVTPIDKGGSDGQAS